MSMKNQKLLLKNSGFTLIETMVSITIMTVVILGVLQILGTQLKFSKMARIDADISNTVFLVNSVLKNSEACKDNVANFGGGKVALPAAAANKLSITSLDFPMGGGKLVSVGGGGNSNAAKLKEMFLTNFKTLSSSGGYNIISSDLNIVFEKPGAIGAQIANRKVNMQLRTDGSGTILDCSGEGTELTKFQLEAMCLSVKGSFNFATKECVLPIPPPQTIVMQVPVPVPTPASASAPADPTLVASNSGNAFSSSSSSPIVPAVANPSPAPAAPSPAPTPAVAATPAQPKMVFYNCPIVRSTNCDAAALCQSTCNGQVQLAPTCTTYGFNAVPTTVNCTKME